jgi:hypothetical protein
LADDFDLELERAFAEAPPLADRDAFAGRVVDRIERGWRMRRIVIGAAGVAGGVFGVVQTLRSNLIVRAEDLDLAPLTAFYRNLEASSQAGLQAALQPYGGYSREVLWAAAALAVVAVTLAAVRAVDEF